MLLDTTNWLNVHIKKVEFSPQIIGDNYQPLGVRWARRNIDSKISNRRSHQIISFYDRHGVQTMLLGGWCSRRGARLNDVYVLSDISSPFKSVRVSSEWSPRCNFRALCDVNGSHVYVVGGDDGSLKSDVWLSVDRCRSFQLQTLKAGWSDRLDSACVLVDSETLVVCGGRSSDGALCRDVWCSVDSGITWKNVNSMAPWKGRAGAGVLCINSTLILVGGVGEVGAFDDVWSSSDLGVTWTLVCVKAPWKSRAFFGLIQDPVSSELLIFGGANSDGAPLADTWASLNMGANWICRPPLPTEDVISPNCIVDTNGKIVLMEATTQRRFYESFSELKYIKQDCRFLLLLGQRLKVPNEIWVGRILPFAVDTRQLWNRKASEWKKLNSN